MRAALAILTLAALAGCAGLAPLRPAAPAPVTAAPGSASTHRAASESVAGADSSPSSDALAVLATIPEPLAPSERTPPPRPARAPEVTTAAPAESVATPPAPPPPADSATAAAAPTVPAAPADSAAAAAPDSAGAGVPVPEPTLPLGDRPGAAGLALPESALVPSGPIGGGKARPDTCWRLQIGAPPEREKADALLAVATSQLLTPFVIEVEKKRFKVRSRDCLTHAGADALKARARRSGFEGTFVIHTPPPAKAKQP